MKAIRAIPRATRILRSVMVAGAGTAIWMALSATAASADTGASDKHSLLGGLTTSASSTVSSVTGAVKDVTTQTNKAVAPTTTAVKGTSASPARADAPKPSAASISVPVPDVPLPAPVKSVVPSAPVTVHVPVVTPVVKQVTKSTDEVLATVPIVNHVVPKKAVVSVVETVVTPVTETVDDSVEVAVPRVNDVLEPVALEPVTDVTNPILKPVVDAVDTVLPPAILPPVEGLLPPAAGPITLAPPVLGGTAGVLPEKSTAGAMPASAVVISLAGTAPDAAGGDSTGEHPGSTPLVLKIDLSPISLLARGFTPEPTEGVSAAPGAVSPDPAAEFPADPDPAPLGVTGAGSGNSQNGPPAPAAAFLQGAVTLPADSHTGPSLASNEQHLKPVSFDPGSSPD